MKPQMEEIEDDLAAEEENKLINEEYKIWKKNAPYLYDVVITHALDWPSLTCQWFPDKELNENKPYTTHRVLLGTHTSRQTQDYLQIATVQIPKRDHPALQIPSRTGTGSGAPGPTHLSSTTSHPSSSTLNPTSSIQPRPMSSHPNHPASQTHAHLDRSSYDDERKELGSHSLPPSPHIQVIQKINHDGEVNRARYMPQNPDLIATKAISGEVLVFDRTKHPSEPERGGVCRPDIRLVGQQKEGFGLAWSPLKLGHILGASEDTTVCHWDISAYMKGKAALQPINIYRGHTSIVGDVDWHASQENLFASVGDDKMLLLWDTRSGIDPTLSIQAHDREILAVSFSPASDFLVVTGSADKTIALHDIRVPTKKLHIFESHTDEVLHLAWSPHNPTIFASASSDRRVNIWDLSLIGQEQTPDDQEDGPPELLFVHGGHTARPTDFCWAPGLDENWMAASTSEDNVVMVWQPTMRVWAGDEVRIDERELEGDAMEGIEEGAQTMEVEPQLEIEVKKKPESNENGNGEAEGENKNPREGETKISEGDKDEMAVEVEMDVEKQEKAQERPKEEEKEEERTNDVEKEEQDPKIEEQEKRKSAASNGSGTQSMDVSAEPSVIGGDD